VMDKKIPIICGLFGALMLLVFHFVTFKVNFPNYYTSYFASRFSDLSIVLSLLSGLLGYFIGKTGAKSRNVMFAFGQGGMIALLASICFELPIVVFGMGSDIVKTYFHYMIYSSLILICFGSLLSGLFAIISRDFRQFQRLRILPQFTIGEVLAIISLVAVILGSFMSINMISTSQK
jgi:hypothetical protein